MKEEGIFFLKDIEDYLGVFNMKSKVVITFRFNEKNELDNLSVEELKGEYLQEENVKVIVALQLNHPYLRQNVIDYMKTIGYEHEPSLTGNHDINLKEFFEYFTKK